MNSRPPTKTQHLVESERKKKLLEHLLNRPSRKKAESTVPEIIAFRAATNPSPPSSKNQKIDSAKIGFEIFRDSDASPLKVSSTIENLAGQLLGIQPGVVEFALLWPGTLKSLAGVHATATISKWHTGDKRGIRTLVYPARANIFQEITHSQIDRVAVAKLYGELVEPVRGTNPRVTVSCPEKDPFFTQLRSVRSADGSDLLPTVGEVLPHYFSDSNFEGWKSCENELLKNVKTKLGSINATRALNVGAIAKLGSPEYAPDAIFGLGWRTPPDSINKALRALKTLGSPNYIVIDLTRAVRKKELHWVKATIRFLEIVTTVWAIDKPGVFIVSDEPHVKNQLLKELKRRADKGNVEASVISNADMRLQGHPCSTARDSFIVKHFIEPLEPSNKEIRVDFTDTHAAELIAKLDKLRAKVSDEESKELLAEVSSYLSQLASLPSSTRVLVDWLDDIAMPMSVRERYSWPTYRSKLHRLLIAPDFPEKLRLEKIITKCDELWENYANGTPFARSLAKLVEEHTRGTERCCLVFTKSTSRRLAEKYFETFDGYPEGAGFEVLKDCVRMVVSGSLETELGSRKNETVIFAGLDEISIKTLILDERISSPVYVLLTRRNAAFLKATLKAIALLSEFSKLSLRVNALLSQLPDFPDESAHVFFTRMDFVLPTFSFEHGLSASTSDDDSKDPNAWQIVLDNSMAIFRSPNAEVYVQDPLPGPSQTRGFRKVEVASLLEGQRLFLMSGELRELTEASLKEAGIDISNDKRYEASLRQYHNRIVRAVDATFQNRNVLDQARELRRIILDSADAPQDLPAEGSLKNWLNLENLLSAKFEDLTTKAPRRVDHFKAFAKAIGISDIEAIYFWKAVIQPLRGARRVDGRRISEAYADMLLEPESAVVHGRMKPEKVEYLFSWAEENVHIIEAIKKPNRKETDV